MDVHWKAHGLARAELQLPTYFQKEQIVKSISAAAQIIKGFYCFVLSNIRNCPQQYILQAELRWRLFSVLHWLFPIIKNTLKDIMPSDFKHLLKETFLMLTVTMTEHAKLQKQNKSTK